jgi:hypothetical protein
VLSSYNQVSYKLRNQKKRKKNTGSTKTETKTRNKIDKHIYQTT